MTPRPLSQLLLDIKGNFEGHSTVSIDQLLEAFHERGFGFFLFIFALPAALPVPAVGYGTVLALPLLVLSLQQALGRHTIWLPGKVRAATPEKDWLNGAIDTALPWIVRLELLIRPRLPWITLGISSRLIGVAGCIMSLSLLLPLPLTNTVPSLGIALMAVGVMMRDGLSVILGALTGLAWIAMLTALVLTFGPDGVEMIKNVVKSAL